MNQPRPHRPGTPLHGPLPTGPAPAAPRRREHTLTVEVPDVNVEITELTVTCGATSLLVRPSPDGHGVYRPAPQGYSAKFLEAHDDYEAAVAAARDLAVHFETYRLFAIQARQFTEER